MWENSRSSGQVKSLGFRMDAWKLTRYVMSVAGSLELHSEKSEPEKVDFGLLKVNSLDLCSCRC